MTRGGRICFLSSLQQPLGRLLVASALDQDVEHDAGLVHGAPQLMLNPGNFEHDFIQMPFVANSGKATTDLIGELLAELARPLSDSFVADDDATGSQQLLHPCVDQAGSGNTANGVADDIGREPIPGVPGANRCRHPTRLLTPSCRRKRYTAHQVDGAVRAALLTADCRCWRCYCFRHLRN